MRIRDDAKGCLLQLGLLNDDAANQASAPSSTYDVFLSHKRSDAKDFARGRSKACMTLMLLYMLNTNYIECFVHAAHTCSHALNVPLRRSIQPAGLAWSSHIFRL